MDAIISAAVRPVLAEVSRRTISSVIDFFAEKKGLYDLQHYKNNYLDYCAGALQVKTLVSVDKVFHVDDIFVSLDVRKAGTKTRIAINDITTLDNHRVLLIKGLAGQGKSTILRKVLSNNSKNLQRLPIFYELKNYKGEPIEEAISKGLKSAGVDLTEYAVKKLFSSSNVKVYLDAFDEVKPQYRSMLLDDIRRLVNAFQCHVVCTTRPDTEIDSLSEFETYIMCELSEKQIFGIIDKMSVDADKADELQSALKHSPFHKSKDSILKSPILVVLFCISYNIGEEIPSTLSQFYSNIFDAVFHRHDNIKGKVNRIRHWNDNRRIYRLIFECLCFISQRAGAGSFDEDSLVRFISEALLYLDEDPKAASKAREELVAITNLIIEDGFNEYRYVHKSIQEFFAASFVVSMPYKKKVGFYRKCFKEFEFYTLFMNTLFFLEELDYYDYYGHGFVPAVSEVFSLPMAKITEDIEFSAGIVGDFLQNMHARVSLTSYRSKGKETVEVDISRFMLESDSTRPVLLHLIFGFCSDHIELTLNETEWAELSLLKGKKIGDGVYDVPLGTYFERLRKDPLRETNDLLMLGFNVLIRRDYDTAVEKLASRDKSLSGMDYFDF
ncbi:NACHT domain-containing NTPase [Pontibacterium sp.]|uniref:NACHT domain-containing protein n=1 Tax=Pontibacterium sp. TaxID=2036026 RepID=UPI003512D745